MGLFLTLLYILTAYLGPETIWGPLYEFHIEIILAALATLASLHGLNRSKIFTIPQTYALGGMVVSVFMSMLFTGWLGSVPVAVLSFIPNVFTFFLVILNCRKRIHLQMLVGTMLFICLFTIARGYMALRAENYLSPYLISQGDDEGSRFYRLRGLAFINDPNDFAQVMVSLIPCLFLLWRKSSFLRNMALVLVPSCILVFGMYLTHSRGGMLALLAVILFASRKKIGTIPAAMIAAALFAGASVVGWSGGRDVSVEAGSGRMEAWATGIDLLKAHPLFGVGFQRFGEYFYITAHNTVVVCAAELGMFGLFWWVMFVLPTIRDAYVASTGSEKKEQEEDGLLAYEMAYGQRGPKQMTEPVAGRVVEQVVDLRWQPAGYPADAMTDSKSSSAVALEAADAAPMYMSGFGEDEEQLPNEEIHRIAALMPICMVGYFVAGWFLSRAYIMTLFIYGGMVQVIYRWALDRDLAPPRWKPFKIAQYSAIGAVGLIFVVYLMLRVEHMMGQY
ncbi:MAG: O-antigen ligase family protein [Edaphobacter sp.]|uniref:O-antigen ligase family protein n=1 Tax=Edaphobacter sp. TaxID=1934404 RepID=UPI002384E84F|nr:O-antigen ligase family protein [Edaphobacter sp.]MDE1178126.1 O-antigen ligase family protein [Edaphobacter sp.]